MASTEAPFLSGYLPYLLRRADQTLSAPFYAVLTKYDVARSELRVLAVAREARSLEAEAVAEAGDLSGLAAQLQQLTEAVETTIKKHVNTTAPAE